MGGREQECGEAERFRAIDAAFHAGDLAALRAVVEDPSLIPNGWLGLAIGCCLEYAIYHSPLPFVATLLELGAEPDPPEPTAFPPLIAALATARAYPGAPARPDALERVGLLLAHGADPNVQGMNDYTPLHFAVAEGNLAAIRLLLAHGADPSVRTRIDEYETPHELAERRGFTEIAQVLAEADKRPHG